MTITSGKKKKSRVAKRKAPIKEQSEEYAKVAVLKKRIQKYKAIVAKKESSQEHLVILETLEKRLKELKGGQGFRCVVCKEEKESKATLACQICEGVACKKCFFKSKMCYDVDCEFSGCIGCNVKDDKDFISPCNYCDQTGCPSHVILCFNVNCEGNKMCSFCIGKECNECDAIICHDCDCDKCPECGTLL